MLYKSDHILNRSDTNSDCISQTYSYRLKTNAPKSMSVGKYIVLLIYYKK